jgi:hypothetical protein
MGTGFDETGRALNKQERTRLKNLRLKHKAINLNARDLKLLAKLEAREKNEAHFLKASIGNDRLTR